MRHITEEIELLNGMINQANNRNSSIVDDYKKRLQGYWNQIFDNDKLLEKECKNAENASEYTLDECGGISTWFRVKSDYSECKEYFEAWLSDSYCLTMDWENNCLQNYLGDDHYSIQDDARGGDNGVWQGHKMLFSQDAYTDENGEVNEASRNALIEAHMEKAGCFPGVFRVTQYGDVYLVNTSVK